MNLHGALADTEFIGNDFIGFAGDDQVHHLPLALGQFFDVVQHFCFLVTSRAPFLVGLERLGYLIQQFEAFFTLMITAFCLNVAVPLTISWWRPYYNAVEELVQPL